MSQQITKCPMCSTKLKMINGRMTCKDCGYYVRNAETEPAGYDAYQTDTAQASTVQTNQNNSKQPNRTYTSTTGNGNSAKSTTSHNSSAGRKLLVRVGAILIMAVVGGGIGFVKGSIDSIFDSAQEIDVDALIEDLQPEISIKTDSTTNTVVERETTTSTESTPKSEATRRIPESDFFVELVEVIWGKAYRTITAEEYASLTALEINRDDKVIYYQLGDQDPLSLSFMDGSGMDFSDLACFPGLEWLCLDSSLYSGDLDGLHNLYAVHTQNTIGEYLNIIPNPENILELSVEDSIFEDTLSGIEKFPNLMSLSVDYGSLKDISALASLPNLLELTLTDCDSLTDYSPLMSLTNLEYLSIQSDELKTIDFVKVMPNLTGLAIEDSQILKLDTLENCTGLTYLYLMNNYNVTDYSVIEKLTQLTSLTFSAYYDDILPSLAALTQLQDLTLDGVRDISLLKDAVNVTYLSMTECSGWELEAITSMKELNTLVINDFASLTESLAPLTQLPKLEILDLSETSVFGNMEEIFGIPTLRQLYLDDCQVGLDFNNIPTNETLEILSMNNIRVLVDPSYNSGVTVSLAEHCDMFSHFPNLTELYLTSLQLDNIDFVVSLPHLQYLDITNNNVTSLKPLEALSEFLAVWCGKNTILENLPADSPIWVITSDNY